MENTVNSSVQNASRLPRPNIVPSWIAGTAEYTKARDIAATSHIFAAKVGRLGRSAMKSAMALLIVNAGVGELAAKGAISGVHAQFAQNNILLLTNMGVGLAVGAAALAGVQEIRYRLALRKAAQLIQTDNESASPEALMKAANDTEKDAFGRLVAMRGAKVRLRTMRQKLDKQLDRAVAQEIEMRPQTAKDWRFGRR